MNVAPARGEAISGGDHGRDEEGKGLTNEDFRRLLERSRGNNRHKVLEREEEMNTIDVSPGVSGRGSVFDRRPSEAAQVGDVEGAIYRDRAEERRRGMIIEAKDDNEEGPVVKGLDYSLLAKAREERTKSMLEQQQRNKPEDAPGPVVEEQTAKPRANLAKSIELILKQIKNKPGKSKERMSNLIKGIRDGKMSYVYKMNDAEAYEMPTIKMKAGKSIDVKSKNTDKNMTSLPASLIDEISNIMQYTLHGGSAPREASKLASTDVTPSVTAHEKDKEDSEEEDIFGDAGTDYVPEKVVHKAEDSKNKASYFEWNEPKVTDDLIPHDTVDVVKAVQEKIMKKDKRTKLQEQIDGYDECYPGYVDSGALLDDSDDEGKPGADDETKVKISKKQELRRDQAKEKAKIEHELSSIKKIFDEKGYEHNAAFQKKGRAKSAAAEPGVMKKKRRI